MSVLRLQEVTYAYPSAGRPALRDVTLTVEPGEFCVLAGLSGSGKSTLLRAAAGLVPHFHGGTFSGTVIVDGLDTRTCGPAEIGTRAGTLLQDPESQIVMGTVRAELALAVQSRGRGAASVARAVEETALSLGIAHLLDRSTAELSGGELQRVALGAALVARPRLVLLDEPTSQLDPVAGDELIWQLRRLNQEADTAVILDRAPSRALPGGGRPGDRDGRRVDRLRQRPGRVPGVGRRAGALPSDPGGAAAAGGGPRPSAERGQAGTGDPAPPRVAGAPGGA